MPVTLSPLAVTSDLITTDRAVMNAALLSLNGSNPALLAKLIATASSRIRRECGRDFNSQGYSEYFSGSGYPYDALQLRQFPVTAIARVACSPRLALRVSNVDAANQRATVATTSTGLSLVRVASGVSSQATLDYADHPTLSALAAALGALGGGWTAVADTDYALWPSADLRPLQGALSARDGGAELELYTEDLTPGSWRLDASAGILHGAFPQGASNIRVDYTAGFAAVPEDVQEACVQFALDLYNAGKADANVQSYHLGPYGQTKAKGGNVGLSTKVRQLLAPYVDHASKLGDAPCR